jgi:hypothetical protein
MEFRRYWYGLAPKISLLVLLTILAFCSLATAQTIFSPDYFPAQPGNVWKYRVNGMHKESAQVLSGTVNVEGVETSVLQSSPTGLKAFVTSASDGIRLHRLLLKEYPIPGLGNVAVTMTLIPPLVLVGGSIDPAQTFNSSGIMRTNSLPVVGMLELPYSSSFTYDGFDVATVPAGTFDAIRISGTLTVQGQVGSVVIYAASGLGVVKATATNSLIPDASLELISTNAGNVTLITPNGGDVLPTGQTFPVSWEASADAMRFKLKYSLDNGVTWVKVPGADNLMVNNFDWAVPAVTKNQNKSLLKVIGYNALGGKVGADISDEPFTIEVVSITAPLDGANVAKGTVYAVMWHANGTKNPVNDAKVFYTFGSSGIWKRANGTLDPSLESFDWNVPSPAKTKIVKLKVVLKDASGATVGKAVSGAFFVE